METSVNCTTGEINITPLTAEAELAIAWKNLRSRRNAYLTQSDWTQVVDAPVDQAAWAQYRQALRALPENTVDPFNPQWPERP